jgi:hypothetical protein
MALLPSGWACRYSPSAGTSYPPLSTNRHTRCEAGSQSHGPHVGSRVAEWESISHVLGWVPLGRRSTPPSASPKQTSRRSAPAMGGNPPDPPPPTRPPRPSVCGPGGAKSRAHGPGNAHARQQDQGKRSRVRAALQRPACMGRIDHQNAEGQGRCVPVVRGYVHRSIQESRRRPRACGDAPEPGGDGSPGERHRDSGR